jgi:hypothetical protein
MPKFLIPYSYKRGGYIHVEAESLEQAKEKALEESDDNLHNECYIADSFEVDDEFSHEVKE